mgnify:CR=1 FL=1
MRLTLAALLLATPAAAWEFRADPVCTLTHDGPEARVVITRDPALAEPYTIAVTRSQPWPATPGFAIRYEGARPFAIGTDRHRRSPDGRSLSVSDTGFGNLLDGLELGGRAVAIAGDAQAAFDLTGAAGPVQAFRACSSGVPVG